MPSRLGYRTSLFGGYFPPGLKWLLIVNTAVFVLDFLFTPLHRLLWTLFALYPAGVIHGVGIPFVWQLVHLHVPARRASGTCCSTC